MKPEVVYVNEKEIQPSPAQRRSPFALSILALINSSEWRAPLTTHSRTKSVIPIADYTVPDCRGGQTLSEGERINRVNV